MNNFTLITSTQQLEDACRKLGNSTYLAVDTEFVREKTYFPQLALIQLADNVGNIFCIDPVSMGDLSAFETLLYDPAIIKVFHAAHQDLEIFYHLFGRIPGPLFDTQVSSAILGHGEQIGYAKLVETELNINLDKSHTRTDWLRRPLSQQQLAYAANDVKYLAQIYPLHIQRLQELGRTSWLDDDITTLSDVKKYEISATEAWKRVKGINRLKGLQLAIVRELAGYREQVAVSRDLPRRRVLPDELLIDIARMAPDNREKLATLRSASQDIINRHANTIIDLVASSKRMDPSTWPKLKKSPALNPNQKYMADILMVLLQKCADENKVAASVLAGRKDIEQLISSEESSPLLHGWRLECCGRVLADFLKGASHIVVANSRLTLVRGNRP